MKTTAFTTTDVKAGTVLVPKPEYLSYYKKAWRDHPEYLEYIVTEDDERSHATIGDRWMI